MPLPDGGKTAWPPKHCQRVNEQIGIWSAWFSGDPEQLQGVYAGTSSVNPRGHDFFASEAGTGIRGRARAAWNTFWGRTQATTEQIAKLHLPAAGDIAAASADLLFSEPPNITSEDTATTARLTELVDDGMHSTLLEAAEIAAALGGVYLRVVWDRELHPDGPWIAAAHPDVAVPEWSYGRLTAVTFWRVLRSERGQVHRHLERHEPGRILHAVYEGTEEELGWPRPLSDYPETAGLAEHLVDGNAIVTGATGLTAAYVPNMRPNRIWRNDPNAAWLGRSDYSGTEQLMDALDETYSSWMRDVDQGRGRLVIPSSYLSSLGAGQGARFDTEQSMWLQLPGVLDPKDMKIEQVQFDIRFAEHQATAAHLFEQIVARAGYSTQTFGLAGDVAATATEVAARERRSFMLRDRKIRYWRPALGDILIALLEVDRVQFGTAVNPTRPNIDFGDSVSVDPLAQAQTLVMLDQAGAISTEQKVTILHPDWNKTQVDEEVALIAGPPLQDPGTFTGVPQQPPA